MNRNTKKIWKRLIPVIAIFLAINIGFGIEYYLRIPKEWYTANLSGTYESTNSRDFMVNTLDRYVYLASGEELHILDIDDLSDPILLSSYNKSENVYNIAYEGDTLVIAGLRNATVLDISNPNSPIGLGNFSIHINYTISDLEVVGDLVYVSVRANNLYVENPLQFRVLYIFDISDPLNPIEVKMLRYFILRVDEMHIDNNVLYLCESERGIQTFDLSNSTNPIPYNPGFYALWGLVDQYRQFVDGRQFDIRTVGDTRHIFVADNENGYIIGDVTNPQDPQVVDGTQLSGIISLHLTPSYTYLLNESGTVFIYSLNKPTKFRIVGKFDAYEDTTSLNALDIFVHPGTNSLFILRNNGFVIYRIGEGVKNDYYREEAAFSYTWIGIGLSLLISVPLAIAVVSRSRDKYAYST